MVAGSDGRQLPGMDGQTVRDGRVTGPEVLRTRTRLRAATGPLNRFALRSVLRFLAPRVHGPIPSEGIRRILISGSMGIGNAVMFEPALRALRERFPAAHVAVALDPEARQSAVFSWPGLVDEVIVVRGESRGARAIAGLRLARRGMGSVRRPLQRRDARGRHAAIFGRIRYRVGHVSGGRFSSELDWLFNLPVTMGDYDHEVDRYLALVEKLGRCRLAVRLDWLYPTKIGRRPRALPRISGFAPDRPWLRSSPGAARINSGSAGQPSTGEPLASGLTAARFTVLGLGSADEQDLLAEICHETGVVNLAGSSHSTWPQRSSSEVSSWFPPIAPSTHIAGAVGTPIFSIFGPTDRTRTRPYGTGHTMLMPVGCRGNRNPVSLPAGYCRRIVPGVNAWRAFGQRRC